MDSDDVTFLEQAGERLAVSHKDGAGPGCLWLGGLKSDMNGTKAEALARWAEDEGRAFTRFDYFGHGQSGGAFKDATIGRWRSDALAVLDDVCEGEQILIGSSLGGWIALLAALARPERVKALVLIAPAPDLTETLMWETFPLHVREAIEREGEWTPHAGNGPDGLVITRRLIEEGRNWLVLNDEIAIDKPVRILQGWQDRDVPWSHAVRVLEALRTQDVTLELIKPAGHRLSAPDEIARIVEAILALSRPRL